MSYSFVFGNSGSGKTTRAFTDMIAASLKEPERRFFVLVPEQYSMQMQKRLLLLHPLHASDNIEVLSFNRLSYRVFSELNLRNPEMMDDTGKAMILRKVAAEQGKSLTVWREQFKKPGFVNRMKSMISELYQYGIGEAELLEAEKNVKSASLGGKLHDMRLMFCGFSDFIKDRYITTEELLDVFCRVADRSLLIRDSVILLDGFTGFTPVQYRLLEHFLCLAKKLTFTVTVGRETDPYRRAREEALFYMSTEMTIRITDLAAGNGVSHEPDLRLADEVSPRFRKSPELSFLERHFLRYDGAQYTGEERDILITEAASPKEEAELVSHRILKLVKKEGFRFRDLAVVTGDLSGYKEELQHEFRVQGIPFYLDENLDITQNPLPEFLKAALACVTDSFSYESVIRFLKCGLVTEDTAMMNLLDNYMLEGGISGYRRLAGKWTYVPKDLAGTDMAGLNAFREHILAFLDPLKETASDPNATVGSFTEAMLALMKKAEAEEKLSRLRDRFLMRKELGRAREYERVYPEVLKMFTEMKDLLGKEPIRREEYAGILDAGLNEIKVGMIPACADRVAVGDLKRTRLDSVRALFLLGANDGIIPSAAGSTGVLTDREKESLKAVGLALSPTVKEDLYTQRYYLYRMLTEPSEKLFVSFSAADLQGKARRVSGIVNQILKCFPGKTVQGSENPEPVVYSEAEAERLLIRNLRDIRSGTAAAEDSAFRSLFAWFRSDPVRRKKAADLTDAAFFAYRDTGIGTETAEALYGDAAGGSVSRLEHYAQCPAAHFLRYGLSLEERKQYEVGASDIGSLAHEAIRRVFEKAEHDRKSITEMTDTERDRYVEEAAGEALLLDERRLFTDNARNRFLADRLIGITKRSVWAMAEQLRRGEFRPAAFEKGFGEDSVFRGRIDRADFFSDSARILVKIIDYKTGSTRWEPFKILEGTQLQLVLYLDALTELLQKRNPGKEIIPAAILYEEIQEPVIDRNAIDADKGENADLLSLRELKPSGLVNSDPEILRHLSTDPSGARDILPVSLKNGILSASSSAADTGTFTAVRTYGKKKAAAISGEIKAGRTSAYPLREDKEKTACTYCPYGAVCGFDRKTEGYRFRRSVKRKPAEVWEEIRKDLTEGTD